MSFAAELNLELRGRWPALDRSPLMDVAVQDSYAYGLGPERDLVIFDVRNPVNPRQIGTIQTSDAYDLGVSGRHVYLAEGRAGLGVIDISDPANPRRVAACDTPGFVAEVARAAGGAENEIFPEEMPIEDLRPYLETVQSLPPHIRIRINSKPAGLAGNIDKTLFAYYCYLLIAGRNRNVFWTYKEGTSDVPHYWYREFDLNLGPSREGIRFGETIWSREFENALVLVNAGKQAGKFRWDASIRYCDITGKAVQSPLVLKPRTAMLLIKNPSILRSSVE